MARAFQVGPCLALALCFVGFAAMAVLTAGPPTSDSVLEVAAILLVVASPALLATWVVVGAWSTRLMQRSARLPRAPFDVPGFLVAAAASLFPAGRQEFGAAMVAEMAAVEGIRAPWSFALGCARAVLLTLRRPGGGLVPRVAGLFGVVGALSVATRLVMLDGVGNRGDGPLGRARLGLGGGARPDARDTRGTRSPP